MNLNGIQFYILMDTILLAGVCFLCSTKYEWEFKETIRVANFFIVKAVLWILVVKFESRLRQLNNTLQEKINVVINKENPVANTIKPPKV